MTETIKRSFGLNRWIVVLLLVTIGVAASFFPPIRPVVMLPGEPLVEKGILLPVIGEFKLTNTILTTLILDVLLIWVAFSIKRNLGDATRPSKGIALAFEVILGGLFDTVQTTAGKKWARTVFPIMATIILMVLFSNLIKLVPGMETIGFLKEAHEHGYAKVDLIPGVLAYISAEEVHVDAPESGAHSSDAGIHAYEVVPFFRSPSTDLSYTAALALIAVFMVQVVGVRSNGIRYFSKFLNVGRFVKMWTRKDLGPFDVINPFIDIFVGILETISEFAKIISFSFRLLGSMFGGAILAIVIGSLLPVAHFGILFLEIFFGVIQALVFGMLTMVFMTVASQSHGHGDEGHAEAH